MIVVAITGASGINLSIELIKELKKQNKEYCVIFSKSAKTVLETETEFTYRQFCEQSECMYDVDDLAAEISSGSNDFEQMIVIPCSMKTLSSIANGYADNLITRTADVAIKEHRKLIIVPRESPLSCIHLDNMLKLASMNVIIAPPMFSFYLRPSSIDEMISNFVGRIMALMGIKTDFKRWSVDKT